MGKNNTSHLAIKSTLFHTYLTTLTLMSYPNASTNNRLSSLHGLGARGGRRRLSPQRWFWLVGPLWSAWSAWFDTLSSSFAQHGVCLTFGLPSTELIGKALAWLTSGNSHSVTNASHSPKAALNCSTNNLARLSPKAFWLVTNHPRYFIDGGFPVFALKGSNVRNRLGWATLPGPTTNKALGAFLLLAALVAYKSSKV
jgi:hypothetical protein